MAPREEGRLKLRRELTVWQAIAISLAVMAPSMAANINPQGPAGEVGRAVPLTFAIAAVGVLLVAYGFVRLCQRFQHAGSVYALVGATLGPRTGAVAGWTLLGTYVLYAIVTATAAGIFMRSLVGSLGIWHPPGGFAIAVIVLVMGAALLLAGRPALRTTRLLLVAEGVTVLLIIATSVIVLIRLISGSAPHGAVFTLSVFSVPSGTPASNVFLGAVFGFLSFAGFEAAASLGEETRNARRNIPRAVLGVALFGGVYFVFVTAIEVMGFGTGSLGLSAFVGSGSVLGDLSRSYVGAWLGDVITLGAAISGAACSAALTVAAARLLFALARDAAPSSRLASVHPGVRVPKRAALIVVIAALVSLVVCLAFSQKPFDVFTYTGTIGTLLLLVAYLLVTLGAVRGLFLSASDGPRRWEIVVPLAGIMVLGYTIYRNIWPYPTGAGRWFPIVAGAWILVAVAAVLLYPQLTRRIGRGLTEAEGLSPAEQPLMVEREAVVAGASAIDAR